MRIWYWYAAIRLGLRLWRLPDLVNRLERTKPSKAVPLEPRRLGRIVHRVLERGPVEARCLFTSLVLFRLLRQQGEPAELVIGLPERSQSHEAHAWIEIDGAVIGPPPGRMGRSELVRYGGESVVESEVF